MRVKSSLLLLLAASLAGCPSPLEEPAHTIEMEPIYFTIIGRGEALRVQDYDAAELFKKAEEAFLAGRILQAREIYLLVAAEAVDPATRGVAWYNVALCDVALERPGAALESLARAEELLAGTEELTHARVIRLQALALAGEWAAAETLATELVAADLPPVWMAQVRLHLGEAQLARKDLPSAQANLEDALALLLSETAIIDQYRNPLIACAYYHLAMVYREPFSRIRFVLPVERMTIEMTDKLALLRKTEELLLAAVRIRDPRWAPMAAYETGRLYEEFAQDLLQAEVPVDLTPLELAVYTEELNARVIPYLQRAQEIHRRNVVMCDTYQLASPYRDRSEQRARTLQTTIDNLARAKDK